ncbi:MAG: alcohol dehydrogenase [Rhodospirillaceae bacterium]|nr:alcohol dehydrogenase [Rhodospirillaceae bacterium]|tara:strand:+ start:71 stop:1114 length:1044 start_codon:yes stop_codon:yes gene_type:complete
MLTRLPLGTVIGDAVRELETSEAKILLIVDEAGRLQGTITDGDVRRGLLRGHGLDHRVEDIMNAQPLVAQDGQSLDAVFEQANELEVRQIPIVDADGKVLRLLRKSDGQGWGGSRKLENAVLLMAGGRGTRLHPLTAERPKPMLSVGQKPILENILEGFIESGLQTFYISINYKGDMIKEHFGDGQRWGVDISYVEESEPLGTAGPLGALTAQDKPLIVMNGDILTKVDYRHLLDFHCAHNADATMCVREYDFRVPFGTVELDGDSVIRIEEKPVSRFFVNAGIYVVEPGVVSRVPKQTRVDMPDLFQDVLSDGGKVSAFPIHEYWTDIGRLDDFDRANADYATLFK